MKTEACSSQETDGLFYGAHPNKVMKLVVFISKPLSRIAKKDSTTNATLSVPNKQNDNSEVDQNEETKALEKKQHQSSPKDHVRTKSKSFIKKSRLFSHIESMEKRCHSSKRQLIGLHKSNKNWPSNGYKYTT